MRWSKKKNISDEFLFHDSLDNKVQFFGQPIDHFLQASFFFSTSSIALLLCSNSLLFTCLCQTFIILLSRDIIFILFMSRILRQRLIKNKNRVNKIMKFKQFSKQTSSLKSNLYFNRHFRH